MKLSVIMPVYNEAATLRPIIDRVLAQPMPLEVIAVNDGSTDESFMILADVQHPHFKMVSEPKNRGKGWAIRRGLELVTGDAVIIQDADLEYDPDDYAKLLAVFERGEAQVVYGNRLHPGNEQSSYRRYLFGGMLVSFVTNLLYRSKLSDEPTCYKLFDARLLKALRLTCVGFEFCPEVTAKVLRLGYAIAEVPIAYAPRSFEEGKKITCLDGLKAVWTLLKIRFMPKRRLLKPDAKLPPKSPRADAPDGATGPQKPSEAREPSQRSES